MVAAEMPSIVVAADSILGLVSPTGAMLTGYWYVLCAAAGPVWVPAGAAFNAARSAAAVSLGRGLLTGVKNSSISQGLRGPGLAFLNSSSSVGTLASGKVYVFSAGALKPTSA